MNFATAINTVLQGSPAIVAATDGHIYGTHFPDALPISKTVIVFKYKKDDGTHTLQKKNTLENYSLSVYILSVDNVQNEDIAALVRALLDDYSGDNILDLVYEGDDEGVDHEKQRYYKTLNYKAIYID